MIKTYAKYKDSGVEWLGEIPEEWEVKKLKYLLTEVNIRSETGSETLLSLSKYRGIIPKSSLEEKSGLAKTLIGYKKVFKDTLVINKMQAVNGLLGVSKVSGITSPDYSIYKTDINYNSIDYIGYLLKLPLYLSEYKKVVTGVMEGFIRLYTDDLYNIYAYLPSITEQTTIANFLDKKTAQIDQAIALKQKQIELLKERKQIIIQNAVTKGINPNVKMKDSGIDWIGEIPEHWDLKVMKYVIKDIGDVDHYMPETIDNGVPYVMTGDLKELVSEISFDSCKQVSHKDYIRLSKKIKSSKGDVILARYATIGTVSYIDKNIDFLVSYSCVTIKPDPEKLIGLYLFYYFKSNSFAQQIQAHINTNTQGNVGTNDIRNVKIALPPLSEQLMVVKFSQKESNKFDTLIMHQNKQIDKLKEYKSTLINSAVTGKIKVI
ncbi:MAG: restriction endonuclease subunit S [Gammaproteobacteria bacterium]|nr:restriction endonuclease subunit S [Gammaproteobacteria bacterium]